MGVDARRALILTGTVVSTVLVLVFFAGAASACTATDFTFSVNSSGGGPVTDSSWPGGTETQGTAPCSVTVKRPSGDIVLVGTLGDSWIVESFTSGFSSCILTGDCNTNGGTCTSCVGVDAPSACPLGIPNCTDNRPSCSTGLNGNATASAHVHCDPTNPPTIGKSFGAMTIPLDGPTTLTFTTTNPNTTVSLTGIGFTDTLPSGLVVATPNGLTGSCGGGTITATAASSTVSLSGATLAASASCTFSVNVLGSTAGVQNNSVSVTSTNGGTGNTATASLTVVAPPTIMKSFGALTIPLNRTTGLTFTITNPNTVALTGVAFMDTLPSGLVVATPNGLTSTCGGTTTATAGSNTISLTNGSVAASASCTISVNVLGTSAGVKTNVTSAVTSDNGGTGLTADATITVVAPPTIAKSFAAAVIPVGGKTAMQFTISNPNTSVALTGVNFSDTLPPGLVVATPNGLTGSCGGGAISASAGSNFVSLTGATLAASASCTFSVNVTGTRTGVQTNITSDVSSTNGGTDGPASASVNVVVQPAPVMSDAMLVALLAALAGLGLMRLTRKRRTL
jgi:uncharacterized repeat protein (TIGR01451 family)